MKESIDHLRELNERRTRAPWKPVGPFGDWRRWEMRTPDPDPKSKHEWPDKLFESVAGQRRPHDEIDFAFVAALVNNADELLRAHGALKYLERQALNGTLHPQVVIENARSAFGVRTATAPADGDKGDASK